MRYEQPRLIEFKAERGVGFCLDGSGAVSGGGYYSCIDGTTVFPAPFCASGNANSVVPELCAIGAMVNSLPACLAGNAAGPLP